MTVDLSKTIAPKSDQLNADDLIAGPVTVQIAKVAPGGAEQPIDIHLNEFPGRPFKPSKSMRRVLVALWGPDGQSYVGRHLTLYRDPSVKYGGLEVGGVRISHASHIDREHSLMLTESKAKRKPHKVAPIPASALPAAAAPADDVKDSIAKALKWLGSQEPGEENAAGARKRTGALVTRLRSLPDHADDLAAIERELSRIAGNG